MTKKELIESEIREIEIESKRLEELFKTVEGDSIEICPRCNTKNYHWSTDNKWCCALC